KHWKQAAGAPLLLRLRPKSTQRYSHVRIITTYAKANLNKAKLSIGESEPSANSRPPHREASLPCRCPEHPRQEARRPLPRQLLRRVPLWLWPHPPWRSP